MKLWKSVSNAPLETFTNTDTAIFIRSLPLMILGRRLLICTEVVPQMLIPKVCTESKCFLPCVGLSLGIAIQMAPAMIIRTTPTKIVQQVEYPSPEVGSTKCAQCSSLVSIYSSIQSCSLMSFKIYIGLIYIII